MKRIEISVITATGSLRLRDPGTLYALRQLRIAVVAPASDRAWSGSKERVNRAYRACSKMEIVVPERSLTYEPQYPDDWTGNRHAIRALDMIGYRAATPAGPVTVGPYRLNALLFVIGEATTQRLLLGTATESDLLGLLEREPAE